MGRGLGPRSSLTLQTCPGPATATQGDSTPPQTLNSCHPATVSPPGHPLKPTLYRPHAPHQSGALPGAARPLPTPAWAAQTTHSRHLWHTGGRSRTTGVWSAPGDPWGPDLRTWGLAGTHKHLWEGAPGRVRSGVLGTQVYPPQCVCPCVQSRPPQPPTGPELSEAQPLDTLQLPGWRGLAKPAQPEEPQLLGKVPGAPPSRPFRLTSWPEQPLGPHLPHHPFCPLRMEGGPARPGTWCPRVPLLSPRPQAYREGA